MGMTSGPKVSFCPAPTEKGRGYVAGGGGMLNVTVREARS